ncbi:MULTISPECIES: hydantoinase B/oxoprolinase family protein [Prauserella salsuginis group]|uniref:N-methylhydantoinase B n=2 Tax=Prauserella salsuginis group TaxID=2893672 RepID=A0A839XKQ4_9PSEU|nr:MULTISPECIES: hydantoinase B/oxoprolinase family protein [Prauserella salsuginis group]MBB3662409.1 N-methylhydantoinase B [Prauserella sediminis]MCR3720119.1 N-methylhydantoinase B [Prauserella flava]MCR3734172.1 N-methylhydantoinase B [Prauserella salsuginis]
MIKDPVLIEVIGSALSSVVEEMSETLVRAAYSTNIKERRDCTASVFDARGRMLAQDEGGSPLHLGSLMGIVDEITRRYPADTIAEGDTFIGNDPFHGGGSHLPDIVLVSPVFVAGEIIGWVANLAHHADFGDRGHAHIFQEGLRIPPVRLMREGTMQQDLFDLILLNCQVPHERKADLRAQIAANRLAVTRFSELSTRYGPDTLVRASEALLDYTERRTRTAISRVPDGEYTFADVFDCPELDEELDLGVHVTVRGDEVDFAFTAPDQVRASVNVVWTGLYAAVYYALKTLVDPDIVPNAGLHRPVRIDAPRGSVLNCVEPAAVNGRSETCQRVVDLIHGALADAVPEAVTAASNGANTGVHFSGVDTRTGRYFVYLETIGGGCGARLGKDGLDGVQVHMTNTSNLPVEALETEYPLLVSEYALIDDSGGVGRTRGGMGIRRTVRVEADDVHFWLDTSRQTSQPWGLAGGGPGASAEVELSEGARPVIAGYTRLQTGDVVSVRTAGAGGYGPPGERGRAAVERDVAEGRVSARTAQESYGVEQ